MSVEKPLIHPHLLACMKAIGYQADDRGVCYGISHTAMVFALLNNYGQFNDYLERLRKIPSNDMVAEVAMAVKGARQKIKEVLCQQPAQIIF